RGVDGSFGGRESPRRIGPRHVTQDEVDHVAPDSRFVDPGGRGEGNPIAVSESQAMREGGEAATPVSAELGLASVAIEIPHPEIEPAAAGLEKEHSVGPHAPLAIAGRAHEALELAVHARHSGTAIHHDEIVSGAVHLDERYAHHAPSRHDPRPTRLARRWPGRAHHELDPGP